MFTNSQSLCHLEKDFIKPEENRKYLFLSIKTGVNIFLYWIRCPFCFVFVPILHRGVKRKQNKRNEMTPPWCSNSVLTFRPTDAAHHVPVQAERLESRSD